ncbi:MAG: hypothetical protein HY400_03760, partial [Elusimicrobia bacterium]|nr:hypothetical protein [Elusimicrobiota bacterium]
MTLPQITLKPREEKRVLGGHLWVFSNEIQSILPQRDLELGSLCVVKASAGQNLGVGFYNPKSLIAVRILERGAEHLPSDFFRRKLSEAMQYRRQICPGEEFFRLCFGESDGLPGLVIDKYGEFLVVQILSAGIEKCWDQIQSDLIQLLSPRGIWLKNDHDMRLLEGLPSEVRVSHGEIPERVKVTEDGLEFWVSLKS